MLICCFILVTQDRGGMASAGLIRSLLASRLGIPSQLWKDGLDCIPSHWLTHQRPQLTLEALKCSQVWLQLAFTCLK